MVGPVFQSHLASVLLRFRIFIYVFSADMIKMYRQILVHPSQTCLQRILWRKNPTDVVLIYEMLTVTYGTASAYSLATGCVDDLAERNAIKFPIGCFELSKWASNCPELIKPVDNQNSELVTINGDMDTSILGIQWNQSKDTFSFSYMPDSSHNVITKRTILSEVSRLFDPLGLLCPIVVVAKIIIQDLWQSSIHWDESVPQNIHIRWCTLRSQLPAVDQLQVPRGVKSNTSQSIQLHGFCDASERAYGACVYFRTKVGHNAYRSELLCSKSRVAPLKAVTLARLELSAALLWSVFVSNRVGEIIRLTDISDWHYVTSANNPADIVSRGLNPHELVNLSMWWHGPSFLQLNDNDWPSSSFARIETDLPEQKKVVTTIATVDQCLVTKLLTERSNLNKICRIIAYYLRFYKARRPSTPTKIITPSETTLALRLMCKVVQKQSFSSEYKALNQGKPISTSSGLLSLSPYMDETGLMRVGEQIRQHFWRRWSDEYLHSLQERSKWRGNKGIQLEPNQLVLIKQQNLAPLQWTLGRVQEVHPVSDNIA
ncbi:uncharacterized protein [Temnothorax nylanderi]|uniref:uncharacterized protein n=1 Tax=Temnothorax nylanderi TaxID=102681 RepID=UPI003A855AA0